MLAVHNSITGLEKKKPQKQTDMIDRQKYHYPKKKKKCYLFGIKAIQMVKTETCLKVFNFQHSFIVNKVESALISVI